MWHLCSEHIRKQEKLHESPTPEASGSAIPGKARTKRKRDSLLNNGSYEQILRDDIEKAENKGQAKRCKTEADHRVEVGDQPTKFRSSIFQPKI